MRLPNIVTALKRLSSGIALCGSVALVTMAAEQAQTRLFGRAWLEALVLAILLGTIVRTARALPVCFQAGVEYSAKTLLEIAVVLLGLSVSVRAVIAAGPLLVGGIALVVLLAIALSYGIGRGFGLSHKLAVLIACGNSICGNSAIAATAPVIHADGDDVAAAIAFTAVLGVAVVLALPLTVTLVGFSGLQYGVFAGLTVYAVPQVIAATAPIGAVSVQIGTLVKLVRVLMLGPVIFILSMTEREPNACRIRDVASGRFVPWFILGFLAMIGLRATGIVAHPVLATAAHIANVLTVVAMAALGLSVDARSVVVAGVRVTSVVILSLLALAGISLAFIFAIGLR